MSCTVLVFIYLFWGLWGCGVESRGGKGGEQTRKQLRRLHLMRSVTVASGRSLTSFLVPCPDSCTCARISSVHEHVQTRIMPCFSTNCRVHLSLSTAALDIEGNRLIVVDFLRLRELLRVGFQKVTKIL